MTPRPYLSYSSYRLFGQSPEAWRKNYLLGESGYNSPAMAFGKKFAEARDIGEDKDLEHVTMFLPKYPKREVEMTAPVLIDGKKVVLLGRVDGFDPKKRLLADDKTGMNPWTQAMVDKSEQLSWYAMIYFLNKGIIPRLELNWIATEKPLPNVAPDLVRATGTVQTFETARTHKDFVVLMSKITSRWRKILLLCETEWGKVL